MRFGLLGYHNTNNLGDEIQSLAAQRLLPKVDCWVDRDGLGVFEAEEPVALVLNGWYGHRPENWPPTRAIHPLLVSMHISSLRAGIAGLSPSEFFLREPAVEYLRAHGPVGARDLHTLELLERHEVPSYFSGCLTLTLRSNEQRGGEVVLNDVPDTVVAEVRRRTRRIVLHTTHTDTLTPAGVERFDKAEALLGIYARAHCVITTRLHCALPCLAMGTPVLLLEDSGDRTRFRGLDALLRRGSAAEFVAGTIAFDVERPELNREDHRELGNSLRKTVASFVQTMGARSDEPVPGSDEPAALRFQTLLHLFGERTHALEQAQLERNGLRAEVERLGQDCARLQEDVRRLRQQGENREGEWRRELGDLRIARDMARAELHQLTGSRTWRTALLLRAVAARLPSAAAGARQAFDALGKMGKRQR